MKLNPLSALIEPLERLITEHGSAAILREHLALLKTQASILERQDAESKARIRQLETENQNLQSEVKDLRHKIQNCEKINKQLNQKITKHDIPPASASSERNSDDYHAKRKRLIR